MASPSPPERAAPAESRPETGAWFAPERPVRAGRLPPVTGARAYADGINAGGTAEGEPFVPIWEERSLFLSIYRKKE